MILHGVRPSRHRALAVPLVAVATSPLGHLLAYQARFGAAATHEQSSGAHAYFPAVAAMLGAALGATLVASLLLVAVARLVAGRRQGLRPGRRWPFVDVLAAVFTIQVGTYVVQEAAEALATGAAMPPIPELVLWAALGMLPVALSAAIGLTWLSVHLEAAVRRLRSVAIPAGPHPNVEIARPICADVRDPLKTVALSAFAKRGPPNLLYVTFLVSIF
jgi:hypothetical protein